MNEYDIIAYLDGQLHGPELINFEAEMERNPAFAEEVRLARMLSEDIETQMIRRQVEASRTNDQPTAPVPSKSNFPIGGIVVGLLLLAIAGYYLFQNNSPSPAKENTPKPTAPVLEEKTPAPVDIAPAQEHVPTDTPTNTPSPTQERIKVDRPMAEVTPLPAPRYPAPKLRGKTQDNQAWKALMDKIWYTEYPPAGISFAGPTFGKIDKLLATRDFPKAYVRLQLLERKLPENDSLLFLKGYCLLELGEGAEALLYFQKINKNNSPWTAILTWYSNLALLQTGERRKATAGFTQIAQTTGHQFRSQAQKALQLLQ